MSRLTGVVKKNMPMLAGVLAGLWGGFIHWMFIECSGWNCPAASSLLASSVCGAAMGGLLFGVFGKEKK